MTGTSVVPSTRVAPATATAAAGGWLRSSWRTVSAAVGVLLGLAPHVLHHVGLLAGTALLAGTGGTVLFGVLGLVASVPMLLRLRRRFASWWAPAIGLAVFALMFSVSAFVIGPAITDTGNSGGSSPTQVDEHYQHHHGG